MIIVLYLLLAVLVLATLVVIYAKTKPDTFRIERSIVIKAPAAKVFALLPDFREWEKWSPWEDLDPTMTKKYEGPTGNSGPSYSWEGNKKVGSGRMELMEADEAKRVKIKLDFFRPFKAQNLTEITLSESNGSTRVHWAMSGASPLMSKIMGLFMDIDKMVGKDFEKGLNRIKALTEV
jgi:uncharacterized protein YndB with AHSA1/START domain